MLQGCARSGVLFTNGKEHFTDSFYSGEFQNILYALSLGLYSVEGIDKLKIRFRSPEFARCYNDLVRLGYFQEGDREKAISICQDKSLGRSRPTYKRDKSVATMRAHMAHGSRSKK